MDKKSLKVKIFLNFYGTYIKLSRGSELYTNNANLDIFLISKTKTGDSFSSAHFLIKGFSRTYRLDCATPKKPLIIRY